MVTKEDIASFIGRLEGGATTAEEVEDGLWLVDAGDNTEVVVHYADPVVMSLGVKDEASDAATAAQSARESRLEDAHGSSWRRRTGRKARWSDKRLPYPSRI